MDTSFEYKFNTLLELIETANKYSIQRKRKKTEHKITYNVDMEQIVNCIKPLKKLQNLIGMESIKKNIIDQVLFYAQELNTNEMMHTCLTGPPGVGKTTLGKILSELYCSMGFLTTNNFKVVSRADLIAGYVGQTALKTLKVLNESKGGVLFIDEAYSIGGNEDERGVSYAKECLDTINKFLSENTSDFILIIAGYKDELDKYFFPMNKGLRRRFPWTYDIKDYSNIDLKNIFIFQVLSNGWTFEKDLIENNYSKISDLFTKNNIIFEHNGGDTLILFDKAKICHSRRVFGKCKMIKTILNITDISSAIELMISSKGEKPKDGNSPPPFGMYT